MSNSPEDPTYDPYEDIFAENYEPNLAFAMTAAKQAGELLKDATQALAEAEFEGGRYTGLIAESARKSAVVQITAIQRDVQASRRSAESARSMKPEDEGYDGFVWEAVHAYERATDHFSSMLVTIGKIGTQDIPIPVAEHERVPTTQDAKTVSNAAHQETLAWLQGARNEKLRANGEKPPPGKLCILKNSPGAGKTEAILDGALDEQRNGRSVIIAVRTKAMLLGDSPEILERVRAKNPYGQSRLHVIIGRDPTNCENFANVEAVQAHGYSPGGTVCIRCDWHPNNCYQIGLSPCGYYESRIRAANDSRRSKVNGSGVDRPMIFTSQACLVSSFNVGGGQFGTFWKADSIMMDEDPTDSFETAQFLSSDQVHYTSADPRAIELNAVSALLRKAMEIGTSERMAAQSNGFKIRKKERVIHWRGGSTYAGRELHNLLRRAADAIGLGELLPLFNFVADDADEHFTPPRLNGLETSAALSAAVPPRAIHTITENLQRELDNVERLKRHAYRTIRGHDPYVSGRDEAKAERAAHTAEPDTAYTVWLEWIAGPPGEEGEWQFVAQTYVPFCDTSADIVIGDAYAQVSHYERMLGRTCDQLIQHTAHFPPETRVVRYLTKSTIGYLESGGLSINLGLAETILATEGRGRRVLLYGHLKLKSKVESWMKEAAVRYGVTEWAYEHWWGGRGKDQYNGWDVYIQISEPVQNIGGMLHTVNAREFRDAMNATTDEDRVEMSKRIDFNMDGHIGLAHAMRNSHHRLFLEHERQNINEQTQAINRLRPIWNSSSCYVMGSSVELSIDLLAATSTIVTQGGAKNNVSRSRQRGTRINGHVDSYATPHEVLHAMLAVVEWYGVWSHRFMHSLITVPLDGKPKNEPDAKFAFGITNKSDMITDSSDFPASPIRPPLIGHAGKYTCMAILWPYVGSEPALPLVHRVWLPPAHWEALNLVADSIRSIRTAREMLKGRLRVVNADRQPKWRSSGVGRPPPIFYDPEHPAFGGVDQPELAVEMYHAIMDNQYGPERDGKLVAPNASSHVPTNWQEVPF